MSMPGPRARWSGNEARIMGIEGVLQEGFVTTTADKLINYMRTGSMWPMTFGLGVLCC
jgi:NADH-quinone oxidoreductase subunit B